MPNTCTTLLHSTRAKEPGTMSSQRNSEKKRKKTAKKIKPKKIFFTQNPQPKRLFNLDKRNDTNFN